MSWLPEPKMDFECQAKAMGGGHFLSWQWSSKSLRTCKGSWIKGFGSPIVTSEILLPPFCKVSLQRAVARFWCVLILDLPGLQFLGQVPHWGENYITQADLTHVTRMKRLNFQQPCAQSWRLCWCWVSCMTLWEIMLRYSDPYCFAALPMLCKQMDTAKVSVLFVHLVSKYQPWSARRW